VRLLLDTQCWVWLTSAPDLFSPAVYTLVEDANNELVLSAVSAWEIAIKTAGGKLRLPTTPSEYIETRLRRANTVPLAITHLHALRAGELPRHHRDPFDRLLVAQAQIEGLRLVTSDAKLRRYDVELIEARSG